MPENEENLLNITLTKSVNSRKKKQKLTIQALGLRKIRQSVKKIKTPSIMGMISNVSHLITVEEIK